MIASCLLANGNPATSLTTFSLVLLLVMMMMEVPLFEMLIQFNQGEKTKVDASSLLDFERCIVLHTVFLTLDSANHFDVKPQAKTYLAYTCYYVMYTGSNISLCPDGVLIAISI